MRERDSSRPEHTDTEPSYPGKWLWFIGLWMGGVAAVGLVAWIIRSAIL
ncbi:MAG: hypothetical protein AB8B57_03910 [Congregibacter sp.]